MYWKKIELKRKLYKDQVNKKKELSNETVTKIPYNKLNHTAICNIF